MLRPVAVAHAPTFDAGARLQIRGQCHAWGINGRVVGPGRYGKVREFMVQRSAVEDNPAPVVPGTASDINPAVFPATRRHRLWLGGALLLVAAAALFMATRPGAQQPPLSDARPAVPVTTAKSERLDVPIWLRGIGTVQALNTVTVRTRVDGTLDRFPVTEGQLITKGTLLAVIDPRPFQAALDLGGGAKRRGRGGGARP